MLLLEKGVIETSFFFNSYCLETSTWSQIYNYNGVLLKIYYRSQILVTTGRFELRTFYMQYSSLNF